jgi:hypothetical protein
MRTRILIIVLMGMLAGCASSASKTDTYTDRNGDKIPIGSDRELCTRSCNDEDARCMDTDVSIRNGGVNEPTGMFGASADCRETLSNCLKECKSR